jgi:hypothetical protein
VVSSSSFHGKQRVAQQGFLPCTCNMHAMMQATPKSDSPEFILMQGRRQATLQMQGGTSGASIVRREFSMLGVVQVYSSITVSDLRGTVVRLL